MSSHFWVILSMNVLTSPATLSCNPLLMYHVLSAGILHEVTTEKSSHCQKRILAAIAKQQTATYGLFLSPFGKITKDQFNSHQQLKPNQQPLISQV